jgi:hypothetical protein
LELFSGILFIIDNQTGQYIPYIQTKSGQWRIKAEKGYRYFTQKDIDSAVLRKEFKELPPEKQKIRNNVEATIFQFCFHTRNNKTRYRGLAKHKLFAFARCLWINLVRIVKYGEILCKKSVFTCIFRTGLALARPEYAFFGSAISFFESLQITLHINMRFNIYENLKISSN